MKIKKILIIFNPIAGKGNAIRLLPEVKRLFSDNGFDYEIAQTTCVGDAKIIAEKASTDVYSLVVAAGGDGTINEVVNGLMENYIKNIPIPAMAVLSVGRGNDFAYGADIPSTLEECVDVIKKGSSCKIDIGLIKGGDFPDGKYFANGIGIGFDTKVGLEAAKMKNVHGFMAYVFGALKTFIQFPKAPKAIISFDNKKIEQTFQMISIMNGKRMGGTFFMAPHADNTDGKFELCMCSDIKKSQMLSLMLAYTKGTQFKSPFVKAASSSSYDIFAPEKGLVCHADGETICLDGEHLSIDCIPSAIKLVCQPGRVPKFAKPEKLL